MKNCNDCKYCWTDDSVGYRECTCKEEFTDEEAVKYYEDMEDGCPHYENMDWAYMDALDKAIKSGAILKFTV